MPAHTSSTNSSTIGMYEYEYVHNMLTKLIPHSLDVITDVIMMRLKNPSLQTQLVLLCCVKRLCILKGAIQIRYYY